MEQLKKMMSNQAITFVVDYDDICEAHVMDEDTYHSNFLHSLLNQNPRLFLKAMRKASHGLLLMVASDYGMEIAPNYKATIANATMFRREITDINNDDVGHLLYTEDFVISTSSQKDYTKSMAWFCGECGRITYKPTIGFKLPRLRKCIFEIQKILLNQTKTQLQIQCRK
jgi:DNA replicative helicase MCM subunit Mcm2 (Cdc46/Mcm family)